MIVPTLNRPPRFAAILAAEKTGRTRTRVPGTALAGMAGAQPERMLDGQCALAQLRLGKSRRLFRLLPGAAHVARAEDRWPEMPRFRCHQHGLAIARIEHYMMNYVAEEVRPRVPTIRRSRRSDCVLFAISLPWITRFS